MTCLRSVLLVASAICLIEGAPADVTRVDRNVNSDSNNNNMKLLNNRFIIHTNKAGKVTIIDAADMISKLMKNQLLLGKSSASKTGKSLAAQTVVSQSPNISPVPSSILIGKSLPPLSALPIVTPLPPLSTFAGKQTINSFDAPVASHKFTVSPILPNLQSGRNFPSSSFDATVASQSSNVLPNLSNFPSSSFDATVASQSSNVSPILSNFAPSSFDATVASESSIVLPNLSNLQSGRNFPSNSFDTNVQVKLLNSVANQDSLSVENFDESELLLQKGVSKAIKFKFESSEIEDNFELPGIGNVFGSFESSSIEADDFSPTLRCAPGESLYGNRCVRPKIFRNVYLFGRNDDTFGSKPLSKTIPVPEIDHNIIFVQSSPKRKSLIAPPAHKKTIVYVLEEENDSVEQVQLAAHPEVDPEVYYVKVKDGENPELPGGFDLKSAFAKSVSPLIFPSSSSVELDTSHSTEVNLDI